MQNGAMFAEELQNIAAEYIALAYEAKTASGRDKP
jgi:hypothetical protein